MLYEKNAVCARLISNRFSNQRIKVLDLGCGYGRLIDELKVANLRYAPEVSGIDISPRVKETCLRKGYKVVESCDLDEGIDHPSATFNVVHAGELIEHLHDTDKLLSEIFRVLTPSGLALITTPNLDFIGNIYLILRGRQLANISSTGPYGTERHVSYFSPRTLKEALRKNGFRDVQFHENRTDYRSKGLLTSIMLAMLRFPIINRQMSYTIVASATKY